MTKGKVAIITRTKERNLFLKRSIKSALDQTYKNWELIIINDGGDKDSLENTVNSYKEQLDGRYKIFHNDISVGMEAASNIGIKNSESEFVVIHDDDDTWAPTFLEECTGYLNDTNEMGVVTHRKRILEEVQDDKIIINEEVPNYTKFLDKVSIADVAYQNVFTPIAFLFKRAVFDEIGYYREDLEVLGDWEFNLRFLEKYDIGLIQKPLANSHMRMEITQGVYGNTIFAQSNKHVYYRNKIKNERLRKDFASGNFGMGSFMNLVDNSSTSLVREKSQQSVRDFIEAHQCKNTYFYGAGTFAIEMLKKFPELKQLNIKGFIDSNIKKRNTKLEGYNVYHTSDINALNPTAIIITTQRPELVYHNLTFLTSSRIIYDLFLDMSSVQRNFSL